MKEKVAEVICNGVESESVGRSDSAKMVAVAMAREPFLTTVHIPSSLLVLLFAVLLSLHLHTFFNVFYTSLYNMGWTGDNIILLTKTTDY